MTVYNVGARVGYYTLMFSRLVGMTEATLTFEPFGPNAVSSVTYWNPWEISVASYGAERASALRRQHEVLRRAQVGCTGS